MSTTYNLTRRNFVEASAAGAMMGAAGLGIETSSARADEGGQDWASRVNETIDCDVAVVGCGISGLAATVQAAELGARVVTLEASVVVGGNGSGTEGMFGVNSPLQREQGIEIPMSEILGREIDFFNYKIDATFWSDQVSNSGDSIEWLIGNGVKFSGVVDDYSGVGEVPTFHWYDGTAGDCYIAPMQAKAEELGAQILTERHVVALIQQDGAVTGCYAEKDDDSVLQVNAKAVILASGGFGSNAELIEKQGIVLDNVALTGIPTNVGDGLTMALAAGGFDNRNQTAYLCNATLNGIDVMTSFQVAVDGTGLWVNTEGLRYTNENCGAKAMICAANAVLTQQGSFMVYDQAGIDALTEKFSGMCDLAAQIDQAAVSDEIPGVIKADTLEGLADAMGVPNDTLAQTVETYNDYCSDGVDLMYGKPAELLVPVAEAPFYALKHTCMLGTTMGGILVNRDYQVIDAAREPIAGLYAVGTDSCMLYDGTYTIEVPASIGGHNLNSGRTAAKHACSQL